MREYYSPKQVLKVLPYKNVETIYRKIRSGELKARKIGRLWVIKDKWLKNFIERN